jgi:hypothetical protein
MQVRTKKHVLGLVACAVILAAGTISFYTHATEWDSTRYGDPKWMDPNYQHNYAALPKVGQVTQDRMPWSDDYWGDQWGGIAARWRQYDVKKVSENPLKYQTDARRYNYKLLSRSALKNMSEEEIDNLSPAEKYDIYKGKYLIYPTVTRTRWKADPTDAYWEGICHGWTAAAVNHQEPDEVTVTNGDGIKIHFGSSDVKALFSFYYGIAGYHDRIVRQVGWRYNSKYAPEGAPAEDILSPAAFHIILSNQLGIKNRAFIADVANNTEVWNQPIMGFQVLSEETLQGLTDKAAAGTVTQIKLKTRMDYVAEINPTDLPVVGSKGQRVEKPVYEYVLDLNAAGDIIGGQWISARHPGWLWSVEPLKPKGYYEDLFTEIYKPAALR